MVWIKERSWEWYMNRRKNEFAWAERDGDVLRGEHYGSEPLVHLNGPCELERKLTAYRPAGTPPGSRQQKGRVFNSRLWPARQKPPRLDWLADYRGPDVGAQVWIWIFWQCTPVFFAWLNNQRKCEMRLLSFFMEKKKLWEVCSLRFSDSKSCFFCLAHAAQVCKLSRGKIIKVLVLYDFVLT